MLKRILAAALIALAPLSSRAANNTSAPVSVSSAAYTDLGACSLTVAVIAGSSVYIVDAPTSPGATDTGLILGGIFPAVQSFPCKDHLWARATSSTGAIVIASPYLANKGGTRVQITSAAPTTSAATITGTLTNANGGVVSGALVAVYKNGSTPVCSATTDGAGGWSCAATGLSAGDALFASAPQTVLSSTQTAVIGGASSSLLLANGTSYLLLTDSISKLTL